MKVKALSLILLVIFAAAATSFVVGLLTSQATEGNIGFPESYSIEQIGNGILVEPNGDPIDTPGGPTT